MSKRLAWLTPDLEVNEAVQSKCISVPPFLSQFVIGAIQELTKPDNWEQHGDMTAEEVALMMWDVYESYLTPCEVNMVGEVKIWPIDTIPDGWILCDGSMHFPTTYPELYEVIGDTYGFIKGRFRLPDYRGYFVRGRNAVADGDITLVHGSNTSSVPGNAVGQHSHEWYDPVNLPSVNVVKWEGTGTAEAVAKVAFTPLVPGIKNDLPTETIDIVPLSKTANYIIYHGVTT